MSERAEHRIAILGAGYTGAVAARIIDRHPGFRLAAVTSRSHAGGRFDWVARDWATPLDAPPINLEHPSNLLEDPDSWELDAALVTYGEEEGVQTVADLREAGIRTVHLAGDLRLRDPETRRKWYGSDADDVADRLLVDGTVSYGLTELHREETDAAEIVAGPGCYPTAGVLGLAPLAREGLIRSVVIDGYSGISGAGLGGKEKFEDAEGSIVAYGQEGHRHLPEIQQELAALGFRGPVEFRPHVVKDVFEGMTVSCHVKLNQEVYQDDVEALYRDAYRDERFVEVVSGKPSMDGVRETNLCRMYVSWFHVGKADEVTITVAIDNLWKGASGQGIQNLNRMLGLPEGTGLPASELERIAG